MTSFKCAVCHFRWATVRFRLTGILSRRSRCWYACDRHAEVIRTTLQAARQRHDIQRLTELREEVCP